ncbi:MAG: ABC transporter permease [Acidobacteria bacterium]|nr:ABC transporter permease [Acidobacteriota bacterium]
MNAVRSVLAEARNEFRAGLRGPLVPICFLGLAAYLLIVVLNAEYMREMGGTDVARNSPYLVYLMFSGQAIWFWFAWAWVFGQAVVRDRSASLHEVVLATPVSLRLLLVGRYLGAVGLACLLSTGTVLGFLLVPLASPLGLLPAEAIGPTPWFAFGHAMALYVLPGTLGLGALFLWAAVRTRSVGGPFAVAAVLVLVWMVAMVAIRGAGAQLEVASMLDPSGFAETEEQAELWTPREKQTSLLSHTGPLVVNRLAWLFGPIVLSVLGLARLRREQLVLERAPGGRAGRSGVESGFWRRTKRRLEGWIGRASPARDVPGAPGTLPGPAAPPSWTQVAASEAAWHLLVALRGWGFLLAVALLVAMGVAGSLYHIVLHMDGPLVPRSGLLLPLLGQLCYLIIVFMVAGFAGVALRRDERPGYGEMVDAAPAPLGSRLVGRGLAVCALTLGLAMVPAVAAWTLMAVVAPESLNFADPALFFGVLMGPAFLEVCAITVLVHALFRNSGAAHATAAIFAFVAVLNHEVGVVSYPPGQIGVPVHAVLSEFVGWTPWMAPVLTAGAFKVGLLVALTGIAWLAWPRGTAILAGDRIRAALTRVRGGAGALVALGAVMLVATGAVLHQQLVDEGGYRSAAAEDAEDAAWERRFWRTAVPFSVQGGDVRILVDPAERLATANWRLRGVRSDALHGSLPHGAEIMSAVLSGSPVAITTAHDHFEIPLPGCQAAGCDLEIALTVRARGWPADGPAFWMHPAGAWLRAAEILPSLGFDPDRLVRSPPERRRLDLAPTPAAAPAAALASAAAVAPAGAWTWSVEFTRSGFQTRSTGTTSGPLDFAVGWWREPPRESRDGPLTVLHGPQRTEDAPVVRQDVADMRACVAELAGSSPTVATIVQAPRQQGSTALHGDLLWIPEDEGWDVSPGGFGHWQRRARIAAAIAARLLADAADLRKEPGEGFLRVGVPGWIGMECVRQRDGVEAWVALQQRGADHVVEALGHLDAPARSLAHAGGAAWAGEYAPLASAAWAEALGPREAARRALEIAARNRSGAPLGSAIASVAGGETAVALLGPPASSDVVVRGADRELNVEGLHWRWSEGGWQPASVPMHAVQRLERDPDAPGRPIGPLPQSIEPPGESFTVLHARPGFERSPNDNVWREER